MLGGELPSAPFCKIFTGTDQTRVPSVPVVPETDATVLVSQTGSVPAGIEVYHVTPPPVGAVTVVPLAVNCTLPVLVVGCVGVPVVLVNALISATVFPSVPLLPSTNIGLSQDQVVVPPLVVLVPTLDHSTPAVVMLVLAC
jgi:hypothetical protein